VRGGEKGVSFEENKFTRSSQRIVVSGGGGDKTAGERWPRNGSMRECCVGECVTD